MDANAVTRGRKAHRGSEAGETGADDVDLSGAGHSRP
jgi:hypothetical protein